MLIIGRDTEATPRCAWVWLVVQSLTIAIACGYSLEGPNSQRRTNPSALWQVYPSIFNVTFSNSSHLLAAPSSNVPPLHSIRTSPYWAASSCDCGFLPHIRKLKLVGVEWSWDSRFQKLHQLWHLNRKRGNLIATGNYFLPRYVAATNAVVQYMLRLVVRQCFPVWPSMSVIQATLWHTHALRWHKPNNLPPETKASHWAVT